MRAYTIHVLPNQHCDVLVDDADVVLDLQRTNTVDGSDYSSLAGVEPVRGETFNPHGWTEIDAAAYIRRARFDHLQCGHGPMPAWMREFGPVYPYSTRTAPPSPHLEGDE